MKGPATRLAARSPPAGARADAPSPAVSGTEAAADAAESAPGKGAGERGAAETTAGRTDASSRCDALGAIGTDDNRSATTRIPVVARSEIHGTTCGPRGDRLAGLLRAPVVEAVLSRGIGSLLNVELAAVIAEQRKPDHARQPHE